MEVIEGKVVAGYGVASGNAKDPRYSEGTLALQWPHFEERGLDLDGVFRGTINISVAPLKPEPVRAMHTFRGVKWHDDTAAEDFSFFQIRIALAGEPPVGGYIYWPHPETKPDHFQSPHVIEILAPTLDGITGGATVQIWTDPGQITFSD